MNQGEDGNFHLVKWFYDEFYPDSHYSQEDFENAGGYGQAVTDYLTRTGPDLSNICINYAPNDVGDNTSVGKQRYYAATCMNAFWEYRDFAAADGIPVLDSRMDVLLTHFSGGAAAPMLDELPGFSALASFPVVSIVTGVFGFFGAAPIGAAIAIPLWAYANIYMPDIVYNYGDETLANGGAASDQIKETFYHEFAHSSHFTQVSHLYWINNIVYVVENNGYGDGTANGAGRCAVIEMWGHHIGPTYADQQYGLQHSNVLPTAPLFIRRRNRHINRLEEREDYRIVSGFIPSGLFHDLIDDNMNPIPGATENANVTHDDITGYENADFINVMNSSVDEVDILRQRLRNNTPPDVTPQDIDELFGDYGF